MCLHLFNASKTLLPIPIPQKTSPFLHWTSFRSRTMLCFHTSPANVSIMLAIVFNSDDALPLPISTWSPGQSSLPDGSRTVDTDSPNL